MTAANKISHYRNDATGELSPPHRIGEAKDGRPLYQSAEGWSPVDSDGAEMRVECDRDGNWMPVATAPKKAAPITTRVRLDLPPDAHRHLRMAAAEANLSMARYALKLVLDDIKRKGKP